MGVGVVHQVPRSNIKILGLSFIFKFFSYSQGSYSGAKSGTYYYYIIFLVHFCFLLSNCLNVPAFVRRLGSYVTQQYPVLSGVFYCENIYQSQLTASFEATFIINVVCRIIDADYIACQSITCQFETDEMAVLLGSGAASSFVVVTVEGHSKRYVPAKPYATV